MLTYNSSVWNEICEKIEKSSNNLHNFCLLNIQTILLNRYPVSLCKGGVPYTLFNRTDNKLFVQIRKFDDTITDYDRIIEKDGYYYLQKILEQKDKSNQYLQIKIHKDFMTRFCL